MSFGKVEGDASAKNIVYKLLDDETEGPYFQQAREGMIQTAPFSSDEADGPCNRRAWEGMTMTTPIIPGDMNAACEDGQGHPRGSLGPTSRPMIIKTIFHLCDKDGNKLLNEGELRTFADAAGFGRGAWAWTREYGRVCSELKVSLQTGLSTAKFFQLINDVQAGHHTDLDLKAILEKPELREAGRAAGRLGRA